MEALPRVEPEKKPRPKRPPRRVKLTKRVIDAAKFEAPKPRPGAKAHPRSAFYLWDTQTAGFGVRIYAGSGRKVFVVTYRVRGKQRFLNLGRFGEITLFEARTKALEALSRARQGEDPAVERDAYGRGPTVKDLAERYQEEHSRPTKKPASVRNDESYWRKHILPRLGKRKVADLTREDIEGFRPLLADRPSTFNRVRRQLSSSLNLAEVWGWRPEGSNPCRHVKPFKVTNRERYLSQQELSRLAGALAEAEQGGTLNVRAITIFRLLLLTGCRCGEIRTLQWDHVDLERRCLRLPDSKTGAKVVYLNAPALQVLAGLEREDDANPYVFPGSKPDRPIVDIKGPWAKLRQRAGLEDVRLHDLRHTFASYGVTAGLSLPLIGKMLGHTQIATTERYAHLADDPVRAANERIGEEISAAMLGQREAEVVTPAVSPAAR